MNTAKYLIRQQQATELIAGLRLAAA